MAKRHHLIIMSVWVVALCAAWIYFGRMRPNDSRTGGIGPEPAPLKADDPAATPARAAEGVVQRLHKALRKANPAYTGRGRFRSQTGQVVAADLRGCRVGDLTPLKGMPLAELYLEGNHVRDLTALRGMKLVRLYLSHTDVTDLDPLAGMPLETLNLLGTKVADLRPLAGAPLRFLWLNETPVSDISPLADCPLRSLTLHRTRVRDLTPLAGSDLGRLHIGETPVTDLTPLKGMSLSRLVFTPDRITRGIEVARQMQSIREIGPTFESLMPPERFWRLHSQGRFR